MSRRDSHPATNSGAPRHAASAAPDEDDLEVADSGRSAPASQGVRTRRGLRRGDLLALALIGGLCVALLVQALARSPFLDARWRAEGAALELASSPRPELAGQGGRHLQRIEGAGGAAIAVDSGLTHPSPRWSVDDAQRIRQERAQQQLAQMLGAGPVSLHFDDGTPVTLTPAPRGWRGVGVLFWLVVAAAMSLLFVTAAVLRAHPHARNLPFAVLSLCQAANLVWIGLETLPGLGLPPGVLVPSAPVRMALDLASAAALVHLATLQPLRLPGGGWIAATAWSGCALLLAWALRGDLRGTWWWTQAFMLGSGALTVGLMTWSYRLEPNPFALLMRRLAAAATVTLLLLSVAILASTRNTLVAQADAVFATVVWYLFLAALVLLLPVFSRAQPLMRELALLAGTSTVAISLDLLFESAFDIGESAALALALACALATYAATRRWLMQPMRGQRLPGAERMFERLYRVLREVEARPGQSAELLTGLLHELFEPLEVRTLDRKATRSRVLGEGSALLVPLPAIEGAREAAPDGALMLRFAERGRRMFSREDARLADRLVEQLSRAVAYDRAVERGRSEERARIAQDLHDDIGARLLTLMYKAQTPEMEEYVRHTLKDLKTLTRGLASHDQRLSHAAAEWKADIAHRLEAAQIELSWTFHCDRDIVLGMVQWSALTRVLRELVNNAIQHSCATHLEVMATLEGGRLRLVLADDGIGRAPQAWSHGLGLGGVRKRVKLLGGDVQWRENGRAGIVCTVVIPDLTMHR